jgi:putative phosphoesterase
MKIGLVSDTHNGREALARGLGALDALGAELVLHCGDITEPETLELLSGRRAGFVFGNCDRSREALVRAAARAGVRCHGEVGELTVGGRSLCILHGDRRATLRFRVESGQFDYVVFGHLHEAGAEQRGRTLCINPGTLSDPASGTFAVLEAETGICRVHEVSEFRSGENG